MQQKNETLTDVINQVMQKSQVDIKVALPARVISFDAKKQTATIEVMINYIMQDDTDLAIPPLVDIPVQFSRGGGFTFTCPISKGDEGIALFHDRCIDGWMDTGKKGRPIDYRLHDFSDACFIPGISSYPKAIPDFYTDGASMQTDDGSTFIRMTAGKILIKGDVEHLGDSKQTGQHTQEGSWNQTKGTSTSTGTFTGEDFKTNSGVSLNNHPHDGVVKGGDKTGKPVAGA